MSKKPVFIGAMLKGHRIALDLSINDVVAKLWDMGHNKASAQLLRAYEADVNSPGIDYALSLASIYKCSVHDFTDEKKEEK